MTEPGKQPAVVEKSFPVAVLVTAAGESRRFGSVKKEYARIDGRSVLDMSLSPFILLPDLIATALTCPTEQETQLYRSLSPDTLAALGQNQESLPSPESSSFALVPGGSTRQESVLNGLERLVAMVIRLGHDPARVIVLVHDGARPWASAGLVSGVAAKVALVGACIPVAPLADTPKELGADGIITRHPARSGLGGAQTPQGFLLGPLLAAHLRASAEGFSCTDDAELWDHYEGPVAYIPGEAANRKITFREDMPVTQDQEFRIGEGWDLHRLVPGRRLVIGSAVLDSPVGEDAHSDGDVLWHAVIDALAGACALGDIGSHFPPSDDRWKNADSSMLAAAMIGLVRSEGYEPINLDCTVVIEKPMIGPHRDRIRENLARVLGMEVGRVSVKAKTHEKVDAVGEGRAVEARAVVLVAKKSLGT